MKFPKRHAVANEGVAYVNKVVSESGSIFRQIHSEVDVGLDGYIEFVDKEKATGEIIAVQIKSGESYAVKDGNYIIPSDKEHFKYWKKSVVPVAGIVYDPELKKAF